MNSFIFISLIVIAIIVVILTVIITLALCKISGAEESDMERRLNDLEQLEWLCQYEQEKRKKKHRKEK